jgi:hypothetical protein
MTDGVQMFEGSVSYAMSKIHLWNELNQSWMKEDKGVQYFISVGYNASYFKTDGQQYCTHLHANKQGKCYLVACLCEWVQKDIEADVENMSRRVEKMINDVDFNFEAAFDQKCIDYSHQTSL